MEYVLLFFILAIFVAIPVALTIWDIINCISKKPKHEKVVSVITILLGAVFYFLLFRISFNVGGDWDVQLTVSATDFSQSIHNIIASEYAWMYWILLPGLAAYLILLLVPADRLPPLVSAFSVAMLIAANVFQIVFALQLGKNAFQSNALGFLFYVYHFDILLLSAQAVRRHMMQMSVQFQSRSSDIEKKGYKKFYNLVHSISGYSIFIFIIFFFIVAVIEIIAVIAGQGLDAPVKAFTDTADWTFSQQIPPAPVTKDGHYLCTVAAGGHKKIVRPLRLGTRHGTTIVVNRQLCIANAFEEVIQEKTPRFHKWIRHVYDTYGFPISQLITTPAKADVVYFVMKPLEWIFLIFLYLVDLKPEQRISRQYTFQSSGTVTWEKDQ